MFVYCFVAPGGLGALTDDWRGNSLPDRLKPWKLCEVVELGNEDDDVTAKFMIRLKGYCLFYYREQIV